MVFLPWLSQHWFDAVQAMGIVGSLLLATAAFHKEGQSRRLANLLAINTQHRETWSLLYHEPRLSRILSSSEDMANQPLSWEEEVFVTFLVLNLVTAFHAFREGLLSKPEGLEEDVKQLFDRPLMLQVWDRLKPLQDRDFVEYFERCLKGAGKADD